MISPLGRIMNRFSKDIDNIDNLLGGKKSMSILLSVLMMICPDSARMLLMTFANILGAVILIGILLPWFLIAVGVVAIAYIWLAVFYSVSARELKVVSYSLTVKILKIYPHFFSFKRLGICPSTTPVN
jgi:hypothetical protein